MARKAKAKPIVTLEYALEELRKPRVRPADLGITYKLVHDWELTTEGRVEQAIKRFNPHMAKGGITQRTRKVWGKIYDIAHPGVSDRVEGSLWKVSFYAGSKISVLGHPKKPSSMNSWNHPLGDVRLLGYVSAATREEAMQLAAVTFGPLAMHLPECLTVDRVGPDGFAAKSKTAEASTEMNKLIQDKRDQIAMLEWELNQLDTLGAFQKMHIEE